MLFLVPSDFDLDHFDEELLPFDFRLVPLDDLTHGSADAFAITQICLTDPLCNSKILGSGPGGRLPLADALVVAFESDSPFGDGPGARARAEYRSAADLRAMRVGGCAADSPAHHRRVAVADLASSRSRSRERARSQTD